MTYVSVQGQIFPAIITGRLQDYDWNNRPSKEIKVEMTYAQACELFVNEVDWSIIDIYPITVEEMNENGEVVVVNKDEETIYDNSDYSVAGDIIDHRNGYVSIKMGKPTAEELLSLLEGVL